MRLVKESMIQSKWLLIDDVRTVPGVDSIARTYEEGLEAIKNDGPWNCIIFDHDLGSTGTGYDLMCYLEQHPHLIPNNIMIITQNASVMQKMQQLKDRLLTLKSSKTRYIGS